MGKHACGDIKCGKTRMARNSPGKKMSHKHRGLSAGKAMIKDNCVGKCSYLIDGEFLK